MRFSRLRYRIDSSHSEEKGAVGCALGIALRGRSVPRYWYTRCKISRRGGRRSPKVRDGMMGIGGVEESHFEQEIRRRQEGSE